MQLLVVSRFYRVTQVMRPRFPPPSLLASRGTNPEAGVTSTLPMILGKWLHRPMSEWVEVEIEEPFELKILLVAASGTKVNHISQGGGC